MVTKNTQATSRIITWKQKKRGESVSFILLPFSSYTKKEKIKLLLAFGGRKKRCIQTPPPAPRKKGSINRVFNTEQTCLPPLTSCARKYGLPFIVIYRPSASIRRNDNEKAKSGKKTAPSSQRRSERDVCALVLSPSSFIPVSCP